MCIVGKGPGLASALSGIAVENAEGHRVLLISGSRPGRTVLITPPKGGIKYLPQSWMRPGTSPNGTVPSLPSLKTSVNVMSTAFRMSHTGRPGVVHVDVPENDHETRNFT